MLCYARVAAIFSLVFVMGISCLTRCGGSMNQANSKAPTTKSQQVTPGKNKQAATDKKADSKYIIFDTNTFL